MTTVLVPFYGYLNNRIKKLWNLTKIAKRGSFYFSSQDEVGANVIALINRKKTAVSLIKRNNNSQKWSNQSIRYQFAILNHRLLNDNH